MRKREKQMKIRSGSFGGINPKVGAAVSDRRFIGGLRITLILLGVMVALPAFVMGANLTSALGVTGAMIASLAGGVILALVALPAAIAGAKSRQPTYVLIQDSFGARGGLVVNTIIVAAILGWFGIVATMFGQAFRTTLPASLAYVPEYDLALIGCVLMAAITILGFRALDLLSAVASPLKVILLVWTLFATSKSTDFSVVLSAAPSGAYSITAGISMVVGGIMTAAALAPDITRFARTPVHAAVGCGVAYALGFPLVLMLSGIPSAATGQSDPVAIMLTLGLRVPAMLAVLLIALSTNGFNLYAASLTLSAVAPRRPHWQLAMIACVVGTFAGLAGISQKMTPFLILLSISIPPIASVYLLNFYVGHRFGRRTSAAAWRPESFVAWIAGTAYSYFADRAHLVITSIPALDSLSISGICYLLLRWMEGAALKCGRV